MKKPLITFFGKLISSFVVVSFVFLAAPSGDSFGSPIRNLQQNIGRGSTSESSARAEKKSGYSVKKIKASKKSRSKSSVGRPGSASDGAGDAAYEPSASSSTPAPVAMAASSNNSLTSRIVEGIKSLIGSTSFRGADVRGGRVACAKVVSTALKKAGVIGRVILGVPELLAELKNKGFKEVKAPPFKAGDIVTWRTYDRNKDGRKDNDTHIGIVDDSGQAISNSSSRRMPRRHAVNYAPICRVLRAA